MSSAVRARGLVIGAVLTILAVGISPADSAGPAPVGLSGGHRHDGDGAADAPLPPAGEELTGLQPIDMIFGGSLRHANTRVLLVPPGHGDLGNPTNSSRDASGYLAATLTGIFAWEDAIDLFIAQHPQYAYLDAITVQVELLEGELPETAGYDIIIGFAETSGPLFRGVAATNGLPSQWALDELGVGDVVHFGDRYVLLSLFASAPRAGQDVPDYPEAHEVRGVTMHEFAHVWGLGHSTTWTTELGPDLMNSPYPFVYGDGAPVGDGGERSYPGCISSLDLYGLAHLYRWMPGGEHEETDGRVRLPAALAYERYCDVFGGAAERAQAFLTDRGWPA